jgi:prepilin-type processing-associated H-X9-DG protein
VAEPGFDARHSACWRAYRYTIVNRPVADPFLARTAWWVPRPLEDGVMFPTPTTSGTYSRTKDGWPTRLEDPVAPFQPVITDLCLAEGTRTTNIVKARAGHPIGDKVQSVNLAFADGHVETHNGKQIQWQQSGNWTTFY